MLINKKKQFYIKDNFFDKIFKLDWTLLFVVLLICIVGFGALYSASDGNLSPWALNHFYRSLLGFFVVIFISQLNTNLICLYSLSNLNALAGHCSLTTDINP